MHPKDQFSDPLLKDGYLEDLVENNDIDEEIALSTLTKYIGKYFVQVRHYCSKDLFSLGELYVKIKHIPWALIY